MKSIARILNKTNVHFMSILQVYFCSRELKYYFLKMKNEIIL